MKPYRQYLINIACIAIIAYTIWMMMANWHKIKSTPTDVDKELTLLEAIKPMLTTHSVIGFATNIKDTELATRKYYLAQFALVPAILSDTAARYDTVLYMYGAGAGDSLPPAVSNRDTFYHGTQEEFTVMLLRKKK